jgi:hypothetical protein
MVKNEHDAYAYNSLTAKNEDGTAHFILVETHKADNLPAHYGWLYFVRFYQPKDSILNGTWKFPEAVQVK